MYNVSYCCDYMQVNNTGNFAPGYINAIFRWFKFTLKPPYSGAHERSLLATWDTSHWNFFVKFGLRTA